MTLVHILVFSGFSLLAGQLLPPRWRPAALAASSLVALFWLQPSTPVRHLDFWLPSASIFLSVFAWLVIRPTSNSSRRDNLLAIGLILAVYLFVGLSRYLGPLCCLTPSPPPALPALLIGLVLGATILFVSRRFPPSRQKQAWVVIGLILALFIILKSPPLAVQASRILRQLAGQSTQLANILDLPWLGFSYLAFRLIHVLRDHQAGRLPEIPLSSFLAYVLFFPAYTAGPIHRGQNFLADLQRQPLPLTSPAGQAHLLSAGQRLLKGVFLKYALADSLALFALNPANALQVSSGLWVWVTLYAYALRIFFDFAGYTDIAIALGKLWQVSLPENFDRPYLRPNLTAFWNSWHISLAQWFRAYFFNPLTRSLRSSARQLPVWAIILAGQISTMVLIGLWHGITWNFLIWGAWHGAGLFIHNRWSAWLQPRLALVNLNHRFTRLLNAGSWLITFHFVVLGWVWFAMPTPSQAWLIIMKLLSW